MDVFASVQEYFPQFSWISTFCVFVCTFCLVYFNTRRPNGVPPGPLLLPIIGNLHNLIGKDLKGTLNTLQRQYGNIYGLYVGKELTIFLNGHDVIQDAFLKHGRAFSNRPMAEFHKRYAKCRALFFNKGNVWKEYRTFMLKSLQETCLTHGARNLENVIHNEVDILISHLESISDPFVIDNCLNISVANVICTVLYGKRFGFEDDKFKTVLAYLSGLADDFTVLATLSNCFPFLYDTPGDILGIREMLRKTDFLHAFFWPHVKTKEDTHNISVADLFVDEMAAQSDNKDSCFTEEAIPGVLLDVCAAGMDTTTATLLWAILYLVRNPEIQKTMFNEIESVIGCENKATLQDRQSLPYVESVILEAMRIALVAPLGVPHTVSEDIFFRGYLFPANCTVIAYMDSIMKDPGVWKNPDEFRPERFLSEDKSKVVVPKEFVPFSVGPRSCLGESLARIELFIFLTTLVQKFELLPETDGVLPGVEGRLGLVWRPVPCHVRFKRR